MSHLSTTLWCLLLVVVPVLGASQWWHLTQSDCPFIDISRSTERTVEALEAVCVQTSGCTGFNLNGWLKAATCEDHIVPSTTDLYIMKSVPQAPLYLWPVPLSFAMGNTSTNIAGSFSYINPPGGPWPLLDEVIQRYIQITFPHKFPIYHGDGVYLLNIFVDTHDQTLQLETDESYQLVIPVVGYANLTARTVYGAMRGLETFAQLVHFDFDKQVYYIPNAPININDKPRFAHRGLLLDSSRHFEPVPTIKRVLDSMAYAKLNVLHWHIVDEQSFPFDSPSFPLLASKGAWSPQQRFTVDDVADVIAYAKSWGIRVMIEIDTPGHANSWCNGYPSVCPSATCLSPLNPANNFTFSLIDGLMRDFTNGTRGGGIAFENLFHLGADEVNTDCWTNTPSVAKWMADHGYTADQSYEYFVERVHSIAIAQGRDPVNWQEVWDHFGTTLDKSSIIHEWLPGQPVLANVTSHGYRGLYSPDGIWYLDGLTVSWQTFYQAEPCGGIAPANEHLILGGEVCMWGETVDTSDIQQTIWPRAGAAAERLWSPRDYNVSAAAKSRLAWFRCRLNDRGVAAAPLDNSVARAAPPGPGSCYTQ